MIKSNYTKIINLGSNAPSAVNNPVSYAMGDTVDNLFLHGSIAKTIDSPYGRNSQIFMANKCSKNWDKYCEFASMNTNKSYPNMIANNEVYQDFGLTAGEILVHNTAAKKYRSNPDCNQKCEPYDPLVANSPMVCYTDDLCEEPAIYDLTDDQINNIDQDIVMNKIMNNPKIAIYIIINIFNTMKRKGTLHKLSNKRLGFYFMSEGFQSFMLNNKRN